MLLPLFKINDLDRKVTLAVVRLRQKDVTNILKLFTYSARGFSWVIYTLILIYLNNKNILIFSGQELFLKALFCTFITWVLGQTVKKIYKRKRPFQAIPNFKALVYSPKDDSFPSLHAGSTIAFSVALFLVHYPGAPWFGAWSLIVIFSRLYLGVHYLSDLIGGIVLGIICGSLILYI